MITSLNFTNRKAILADTECVLCEESSEISYVIYMNVNAGVLTFILIFVLVVAEGQEVETWERSTKGMLCSKILHHSILYSYNGRICISESQVNTEMFAKFQGTTVWPMQPFHFKL